jgi:hypothetical protein
VKHRQAQRSVTHSPARDVFPDIRTKPALPALQLQRTIGNQAIQRMLQVSQPNDAAEREADRVASEVTHSPAAQHAAPCSCGGTCNKCRGVQRKATSGAGVTGNLPPEVNDVLRSPGQPLDPQTGAAMSSRFGRDFSHVQVHTDARASASAEALHAEAYTVGHQMVFRQGRYSPSTGSGRRLLAHELTHVVQQGHAAPAAQHSGPAIVHAPSGALQRTATPDDEKQKSEAIESHRKQQKNVADLLDQGRKLTVDPARGLLDNDNLFRNSIEMLDAGHVKMTIYTPVHDSMTRNPGERTYFDSRVDYPKIGGDYPADPAVKKADGMRTETPGVEGTMFTVHPKVPGFMGLFTEDSLMSMDELKQTFVHEVQHLADLHPSPFTRTSSTVTWQDRLEDYKTEFRSFWVQPAPIPPPPKPRRFDELIIDPGPVFMPIGGPMKPFSPATTKAENKDNVTVAKPDDCKVCPTPAPAKNPPGKKAAPAPTPNAGVKTSLKNKRQEEIFWHLIKNYKTRQFDCWYVCSPEFRAAVEAFDNPLSMDLINSVRIFDLWDTLSSISPSDDWKDVAFKKGLFDALRHLDAFDWLFLKARGDAPAPAKGKAPAQQPLLAAPLWARIDAHLPLAIAAGFKDLAANASGKPSEMDIMGIFDDSPRLLEKRTPGGKK